MSRDHLRPGQRNFLAPETAKATQSDPAHEAEIVDPARSHNVINRVVEDGDGTCMTFNFMSVRPMTPAPTLPVTPTITNGCAENNAKTVEPSTDASRTSLTP